MTIELQIPESNLKGFSDQEKNRLKEATSDYASDLIEETNRIEAGRNPTEGPPEVTRGMVSDATVLLRRGLGAPKKRWELRVLRIVAAVLSLMVGIM